MLRSKKIPFLRELILAAGHEVLGNPEGLHQLEKILPRSRLPRKDHIARRRVLSDEHLVAIEAIGRRQPHRLAASVLEQLSTGPQNKVFEFR